MKSIGRPVAEIFKIERRKVEPFFVTNFLHNLASKAANKMNKKQQFGDVTACNWN